MHIGASLRILAVEPIVDPVPDGDFPDRFATVRPVPPRPTPPARAAEPGDEPASRRPAP